MIEEYDAVVVGSGPNGLAAAITLKTRGLSVLLIEAREVIGGGMRSEELTLPGFIHDVCATSHPMSQNSIFLKGLPLDKFGLKWIYPELVVSHPLVNNMGAEVYSSVESTAVQFGDDTEKYKLLMRGLHKNWSKLTDSILKPISLTDLNQDLIRFGVKGMLPTNFLAKKYSDGKLKALLAGMSLHNGESINKPGTAAAALILLASAHQGGWPLVEGGTINLAKSLFSYYTSIGGKTETNLNITRLEDLPSSKIVIFDLTPSQILKIAAPKLTYFYRKKLAKYRYGVGTFKMDWALDDAIPFTHYNSRRAGFVHIGGGFDELKMNSKLLAKGYHHNAPFILLSQPSVFDRSRAPQGKHTAYAYAHVPLSSNIDYSKIIESQIEKFAPGFRDRILARHSMNCAFLENYNQNNVGGDILGGAQILSKFLPQLPFSRSPYQTSTRRLYICSSSTPPGPGVHGMCGYNAANLALRNERYFD